MKRLTIPVMASWDWMEQVSDSSMRGDPDAFEIPSYQREKRSEANANFAPRPGDVPEFLSLSCRQQYH